MNPGIKRLCFDGESLPQSKGQRKIIIPAISSIKVNPTIRCDERATLEFSVMRAGECVSSLSDLEIGRIVIGIWSDLSIVEFSDARELSKMTKETGFDVNLKGVG